MKKWAAGIYQEELYKITVMFTGLVSLTHTQFFTCSHCKTVNRSLFFHLQVQEFKYPVSFSANINRSTSLFRMTTSNKVYLEILL